MKLLIKLAFRNFLGAGSRSWLNVIVLSFSFVVIIWVHGLMKGWDYQAKKDMKAWDIGSGQVWNDLYDPFDLFSIQDAHNQIPIGFTAEIEKGNMHAVLVQTGTIYPEGRMQPVMLKGIDPEQKIVAIPSHKLDTIIDAIPVIIGRNAAKSMKLSEGQRMILRWRNTNGTFDAIEIQIVSIFQSNVPAVDFGQLWLPLQTLQKMCLLPNEATFFTLNDNCALSEIPAGWKMMPVKVLVADIEEMIKTKSTGQSVFYLILLLLAMLAIFDTQVLSIFRRQKEIGTYIALGYTKYAVVALFTIEGTIHAIFAALLALVYGTPILYVQSKYGFHLPIDSQEFGVAISDVIYPMFTMGLVLSTILIVLLTTAVVSYLPSRKIAEMKPTEALRGRIQ